MKTNFVVETRMFEMYQTFSFLVCVWQAKKKKKTTILDLTFYLWLLDQKSIYFPFKFTALSAALWKKTYPI